MVLHPLIYIAHKVTDTVGAIAPGLAAHRPGAVFTAVIHHRTRTSRLFVTPGVLLLFPTATRRILPLRFGRQAASGPRSELLGLVPAQTVYWEVFPGAFFVVVVVVAAVTYIGPRTC